MNLTPSTSKCWHPGRRAPTAQRRSGRDRQRGAATLVVVMVLFFVVALTAAYTARNLLFEQRTSTNQYRSTQAFEAAEAGLEWALAMLNSGRIDEQCRPHTDPAAWPLPTSFRQRYLDIDPADGRITARTRADGTVLTASCVLDTSAGTPSWQCSCPVDDAPTLDVPEDAGVHPAFRVRFVTLSERPQVVRVEANGCTRPDDTCLDFPSRPVDGESRATVSIVAALKGALVTPPAAAVTVTRQITGAAQLEAYHTDAATGGLTLHVGTGVDALPTALAGPPGTPADQTVFVPDVAMAALEPDRMFFSVFGMHRKTYAEQPAIVRVDCYNGCDRTSLSNAALLNPGRILWAEGTVSLGTSGDIGSAAAPVVVVVDGDVSIGAGADVRLFGLAHTLNQPGADWVNDGRLTVVGAVVGEGDWNLAGSGTTVSRYDGSVLTQLRAAQGSFVRVPGSWKDF
jgi:Tfp pilus assembly protein PilX